MQTSKQVTCRYPRKRCVYRVSTYTYTYTEDVQVVIYRGLRTLESRV